MRSFICYVLSAFLALACDAYARGNFPGSPIYVQEFFKGLKNKAGTSCCADYDGFRLDDPEWKCDDDTHCSVVINKEWVVVPPDAIIHPKVGDPPIGYAILWRSGGQIYCFRPGVTT